MDYGMAMLTLKFAHGRTYFYTCESRHCNYKKNDVAYSWDHVKDLGWSVKKADLTNNHKESPFNPTLTTEDGTPVELYCPECSKGEKK